MPGVFQADELAVGNGLRKVPGVAGHGVLVPCAIDKQHWNLDTPGCTEKARLVAVENVVYVKVHLCVFVVGQVADMAKIEALEQGRQVFA